VPDKSVAVLYFENMNSEKESDYFCAGITEDIITDLSKIKDLKVVSRNDVLPFRNKEVNTRQVGDALRVNYILEGSVRTAGNRIRITAQLISVRDGYHLWAERFDRQVEDIFDLQNEVSQKSSMR
jgi:adenylate cyclase